MHILIKHYKILIIFKFWTKAIDGVNFAICLCYYNEKSCVKNEEAEVFENRIENFLITRSVMNRKEYAPRAAAFIKYEVPS